VRVEAEQVRRREALQSLRVLVVDDNNTNRRILDEILANWRMVPHTVSGGSEALIALNRAFHAGEPFQLILSDVNMPVMDGFDLFQELREGPHKNVPFILLTSAASPGDVARCREIGVAAHLVKPIKQSLLMDTIATALSQKHEREGRGHTKAPASPTGPDSSASEKGLRILLAEDHEVNQKFATRVISKAGHRVEVANNGGEAVAAWERSDFDVILMDVQMPEMNGLEATRRIRELEGDQALSPHVPIIAMTANAMKEDREECLSAGMDGYVSKPVRRNTLFAEIERVLVSTGHSGGEEA
jgi:CheY-like chemotaxis protein